MQLHSVPLTLQQSTTDLCLHWRLLDTHRQVWLSLLCGHYSFLLGPGVHKVLFVPSKSLFPQSCASSVVKSYWSSKSNSPAFSVFLPDPQVGKSTVGPRTFTTVWQLLWCNCSPICGLSAQRRNGANGNLLQQDLCHTRLQQYVNWELPDVQAGFRKGKGTRGQMANICWITEKAREFQKNIYFCFTDYTKTFVDHNKLWKILKEMGIPGHLTCLLRNLYAVQEATVRSRHGTTDWFQIGKGARQGYILSPCLFIWRVHHVKR